LSFVQWLRSPWATRPKWPPRGTWSGGRPRNGTDTSAGGQPRNSHPTSFDHTLDQDGRLDQTIDQDARAVHTGGPSESGVARQTPSTSRHAGDDGVSRGRVSRPARADSNSATERRGCGVALDPPRDSTRRRSIPRLVAATCIRSPPHRDVRPTGVRRRHARVDGLRQMTPRQHQQDLHRGSLPTPRLRASAYSPGSRRRT